MSSESDRFVSDDDDIRLVGGGVPPAVVPQGSRPVEPPERVKNHIRTWFVEHEALYRRVWDRLDQMRQRWPRLNRKEKVAYLKASYLFALYTQRTPVPDAERAFDMLMEGMGIRESLERSGAGVQNQKQDWAYRSLRRDDVWEDVVTLLDAGKVDAAHDMLASNVVGLSATKASFTLAQLGFVEKMCLDANVTNLFDFEAPGRGVSITDYEALCADIRDMFPNLSQDLRPYELQWLVFDWQRAFMYEDGEIANIAEYPGEGAVAIHDEWFKWALGDSQQILRRMQAVTQNAVESLPSPGGDGQPVPPDVPPEPFAQASEYAQDGDFGEWPWSRDKAGLKECEKEMEGEVNNQYAFCRAWANEEGIDYSEGMVAEQAPNAVERHVRRLRRLADHDVSVTEIGDNYSVSFTMPGANPNEIKSGVVFDGSGRVMEATIRFPSLTEASQQTRGIKHRFPDTVESVGLPAHDSFTNLGFGSPAEAPEVGRDELVARLRINDLRASELVRPHVILKSGPLTRGFDAGEVIDFISEASDAYNEEFGIQGHVAPQTAPQTVGDEYGFIISQGEEPHPSLVEAARDGRFDDGAVVVETHPPGDLGPWTSPGVPIAENPLMVGQGATVLMPVEDFKRLQTYIGTSEGIARPAFGNDPPTPEEFWQTNPERVGSIEAVLRGDEPPKEIYGGVPMPYVMLGRDGSLTDTQEGRHRTLAAENAGLDMIPVRILYNDEKEGEGGERWRPDEPDIEPATTGTSDLDEPGDPGVVLKETTPERFAEAIETMIDENPEMGAFLTYHPPNELQEHTLLMSDSGGTGVAISPEGDIQNLFNHEGPKGGGRDALVAAIEHGGCILDCYDGYLRDLYVQYGFRETGRMEFNPEFAPEEWNMEKFGQPDVVFMAYRPFDGWVGESDTYYAGDEWGEAKQDSLEVADCERQPVTAKVQQAIDRTRYERAKLRGKADSRQGRRTQGRGVGRGARGDDSRSGTTQGRNLTCFEPQYTKKQAEYYPPGSSGFDESHDRCGDCIHYIEGGGCHLVQGDIHPAAYCGEFYADYGLFAHKHDHFIEVNEELYGGAFDFTIEDAEELANEIEQRIQERAGKK